MKLNFQNLFYQAKNKPLQYLISIGMILITSGLCYPFSYIVGYKVVALILLVAVSTLAMLFDIVPVLIAATLSALIWNFFFIPPTFTFHIGDAEDGLLFILYFVIALLNGVLTSRIRKYENRLRTKEDNERSVKLYKTIMNSVSHEIRTPLSSMLGLVETLKENEHKMAEEQKKDVYDQILSEGNRLNQQVDNLLKINRIENNMLILKKEWCDINELIHTVVTKLSNEKKDHTIIYKRDDNLPLVKIDIGLIEQALQNILLNALKYTPPGTNIFMDVSVTEHACTLLIQDEGNGYPKEVLDNAFEKFRRGSTVSTGGLGLGLSIAKGFVDAHHGHITLENKSTGGALCRIVIPSEFSYIGNLTLDN